jgi:hypothetical protein
MALVLEVKPVPLYTLPPDDGLQMSPRHVEAWQFNKVNKIVHRVGLLYKYIS